MSAIASHSRSSSSTVLCEWWDSWSDRTFEIELTFPCCSRRQRHVLAPESSTGSWFG
jgi:hypothetical protein